MRDNVGLDNELTGPQMPPEVWISNWSQGHQEKTEEKDNAEYLADCRTHEYHFNMNKGR